jgi:hypothetical protein
MLFFRPMIVQPIFRAYADFDGIPSEFFVDDCVCVISAVPMHLRWEQLLIAFANTLQPRAPILRTALVSRSHTTPRV